MAPRFRKGQKHAPRVDVRMVAPRIDDPGLVEQLNQVLGFESGTQYWRPGTWLSWQQPDETKRTNVRKRRFLELANPYEPTDARHKRRTAGLERLWLKTLEATWEGTKNPRTGAIVYTRRPTSASKSAAASLAPQSDDGSATGAGKKLDRRIIDTAVQQSGSEFESDLPSWIPDDVLSQHLGRLILNEAAPDLREEELVEIWSRLHPALEVKFSGEDADRVQTLVAIAVRSVRMETLKVELDSLAELARQQGSTWAAIGSAAGIRPQTAYQKWTEEGREKQRQYHRKRSNSP